MGEIFDVTTVERDLPEPLTGTEQSGFRSGKYLEDGPAIEAVGADERVHFVVTNRKQGIAMTGETTSHAIPDRGYQTVVVVTDRRVIALVGQSAGDERFTLDISEITAVSATAGRRTSRLAIDRADGPTWEIQTQASGLGAVASYLRKQSGLSGDSGAVRATTDSIRGLFEATVDTAKSFRRDRVAEFLPASERSPSGQRDIGGAETPSPATRTTDAETTPCDTETAIDAIATALAKTDWRARSAQPESPFDLLAEREDELVGVVVECPDDGVLDRRRIRQCSAITGAAGTDTVMLATTASIQDRDAKLATELGVRLRNVETLSDASDPPTIEALTEMVGKVLSKGGWSVPESVRPVRPARGVRGRTDGRRRPHSRGRHRQEQYRALRRHRRCRRDRHRRAGDDRNGP
jgi:hypothetical protein